MKIIEYTAKNGCIPPSFYKLKVKGVEFWAAVVGGFTKHSNKFYIPLHKDHFSVEDYSFSMNYRDDYKLVKYGRVYVIEKKKEGEPPDKEMLLLLKCNFNYFEVVENNSNVVLLGSATNGYGKRHNLEFDSHCILHFKGSAKIKYTTTSNRNKITYLTYNENNKELKEKFEYLE